MDALSIVNNEPKELLDAQSHVWNHIFAFLNSMALKGAIELGIPDAIHKHGKPMTLSELANSLSLHPSKAPSLFRLMRLLVHSNFFSKQVLSSGEEVFDLTINSHLLLKNHPQSLTPFALSIFDLPLMKPSYHICSWFRNDEEETAFHIANGKSVWEYFASSPKGNEYFNEGMESDARFLASFLVTNKEFKGSIEGLESLVDVGGGNGTMAKAILEAFPGLTCTVLDQPHVVNGLESHVKNLSYVGGDMFEAIPPAQAMLLKFILHDWSDEHCIKILQKCKEAISSKDEGGKVIIIDMVVEHDTDDNTNHLTSQYLFDVWMMALTIGGKERTEEEWKMIFNSAGFQDYKIIGILGPRSIIEIYPS